MKAFIIICIVLISLFFLILAYSLVVSAGMNDDRERDYQEMLRQFLEEEEENDDDNSE